MEVKETTMLSFIEVCSKQRHATGDHCKLNNEVWDPKTWGYIPKIPHPHSQTAITWRTHTHHYSPSFDLFNIVLKPISTLTNK